MLAVIVLGFLLSRVHFARSHTHYFVFVFWDERTFLAAAAGSHDVGIVIGGDGRCRSVAWPVGTWEIRRDDRPWPPRPGLAAHRPIRRG